MAAPFDLNLIPLYRIRGQEWTQLPGLLATIPPKHPARGREHDVLVVFVTLAGNAPVSSTDYSQIATQMAQRFYQVPGALTSAMRTTAEVLNQYLVDRNMRSTGQGQYVIGRTILAVLREEQLTLAQCGPTHVFQVTGNEARPIHDANISGRGLGIGPSTPLYFAQTEINPGDQLVFCTYCPGEWETSLPVKNTAALEILRRSLFDATGDDLNGVILEFQTGKGGVNILRGDQAIAQGSAPTPEPTVPNTPTDDAEQRQEPDAAPGLTDTRVSTQPPTEKTEATEFTRLDLQQPGRFVRPLEPHPEATPIAHEPINNNADNEQFESPAPIAERKGLFVSPHQQADIPEITRGNSNKTQTFYGGLARGLHSMRLLFAKTSGKFQRFLPRLLPTLDDNEAPRTGPIMALVAVAVPLVIVTAAVIVYMKYGQASQYKTNYDMAVTTAVGAIGQEDPVMVQLAWESSLHYLDEAEKYQITPESQALRQQAESALDGLDGIIRLDFRAAIYGGLDPAVQVTHMAATGAELYLLDSVSGNILRTSLTSQGYTLDLTFQCGPGEYNGQAVATLIDLAALPGGNEHNATVVAMDPSGTLLYCAPEMNPIAYALTVPPLGWQQISGFTLSSNGKEMYVMDRKTVWIYSYERKEEDPEGTPSDFNNPIAYFSEQVPLNMSSAVDLAANGNDLFLLFEDSHVTVCTYSGLKESQTSCLDPAIFADTRPGHQSGMTITDAVFSELMFDAPYNTALYLLEPNTRAIYKVSPHPSSLELGGQFHAGWDQEKTQFHTTPASAMTIDRNRYLFLSIGNQVYFAAIP